MQTNFLVIGSGISGLNFALHAAKKGHVIVVTKKLIAESNTNYAQGGIAAVIDKKDDFKKHIEDTLKTGAYHNDKRAVSFMVRNSPEAIGRLIDLGVQFEKEKDSSGKEHLKLAQEGGHKTRRIAYTGDYTGQEIESILVKRVREHPNIEVLENTFATDLICHNRTVYGAKIITRKNRLDAIFADAVILATGGLGQVYKFTTNPQIATGDGVAIAYRAGAKLKDLEFIQFHPTALNKKPRGLKPRLLLSETLRGEGAKLLNKNGKQFVNELLSRDLVARAIYAELKNSPAGTSATGNQTHCPSRNQVYLSIAHKKPSFIKKRFPHIYKELKKYRLDLTKDLIPVVPVAHYSCGGIKTNLNGQTSLKHLYAFGETACTGVHGANRLASNSLLEAVVFSNQVVKSVKPLKIHHAFTFKQEKINTSPSLRAKVLQLKKIAQETMWEYCGIVRTQKGLKEGIRHLQSIQKQLAALNKTQISRELLETKNLLEVGLLILKAAEKRRKPLGCHFV